jgi:dynein heavy chain 1
LIEEAEKYVNTWLSYESLWKININKLYETLGDDIQKWQILLNEIKSGRNTFDNSDTEVYYGGILINYRLV